VEKGACRKSQDEAAPGYAACTTTAFCPAENLKGEQRGYRAQI
jgi:hypothetical protein